MRRTIVCRWVLALLGIPVLGAIAVVAIDMLPVVALIRWTSGYVDTSEWLQDSCYRLLMMPLRPLKWANAPAKRGRCPVGRTRVEDEIEAILADMEGRP